MRQTQHIIHNVHNDQRMVVMFHEG